MDKAQRIARGQFQQHKVRIRAFAALMRGSLLLCRLMAPQGWWIGLSNLADTGCGRSYSKGHGPVTGNDLPGVAIIESTLS